jgi:hypothetical protein
MQRSQMDGVALERQVVQRLDFLAEQELAILPWHLRVTIPS